jgi:prepilin-type N-terminal cleavage/methylation domain-containing protein
MSKRSQLGFTLIEIIIVTAIGSMLAVIALAGFSTLRGEAQFSDSIEHIKEDVTAKRTEALTTVKLGGGTDTANITFGRVLTFNPGTSTVNVDTLYTSSSTSPMAGQAVKIVPAESTTVSLNWGITFKDSSLGSHKIQVAFVRSPVDGTLETAISPDKGWSGAPTYKYSDFAPNGAAVNLNFVDPSGRKAYLTIDPTNDSVTRTFQ